MTDLIIFFKVQYNMQVQRQRMCRDRGTVYREVMRKRKIINNKFGLIMISSNELIFYDIRVAAVLGKMRVWSAVEDDDESNAHIKLPNPVTDQVSMQSYGALHVSVAVVE